MTMTVSFRPQMKLSRLRVVRTSAPGMAGLRVSARSRAPPTQQHHRRRQRCSSWSLQTQRVLDTRRSTSRMVPVNHAPEDNLLESARGSPTSASSAPEMDDGSRRQQGLWAAYRFHRQPIESSGLTRSHLVIAQAPLAVYKAARPPQPCRLPSYKGRLIQTHLASRGTHLSPVVSQLQDFRAAPYRYQNRTPARRQQRESELEKHGSANAPPRPARPRPPRPAPSIPGHHSRDRAALLPVLLRTVLGVAHHRSVL